MGDYDIAICIMVVAIFISILGISYKLNTNECPDCPTFWDRNNNNTAYITVNIGNKAECIETFPFGYYHTITPNGKCRMEIWKSDLNKNLTDIQLRSLE